MFARDTSRGAGSEARGEGKERGYISRTTSKPPVFLLSLGFLWGWGFCGVADLYRKSSQQRKLRITSLRMFGGVQISFTWVGLCSDAVLSTFCSTSRGPKKLAQQLLRIFSANALFCHTKRGQMSARNIWCGKTNSFSARRI